MENLILNYISIGMRQSEIANKLGKTNRWVQMVLEKARDNQNCKTNFELMYEYGLKASNN
jgi:DNA-binding transcriptional regulator LsrR (DeoR family)